MVLGIFEPDEQGQTIKRHFVGPTWLEKEQNKYTLLKCPYLQQDSSVHCLEIAVRRTVNPLF